MWLTGLLCCAHRLCASLLLSHHTRSKAAGGSAGPRSDTMHIVGICSLSRLFYAAHDMQVLEPAAQGSFRTGLRSPLRRYSAACRGPVASVRVASGGLDGAALAAVAAVSRCAGL